MGKGQLGSDLTGPFTYCLRVVSMTKVEQWQIALGLCAVAISLLGFGMLAIQAGLLQRQLRLTAASEQRDRMLRRRQSTLEFSTATLSNQERWKTQLPSDLDPAAIAEFIADPAKQVVLALIGHENSGGGCVTIVSS